MQQVFLLGTSIAVLACLTVPAAAAHTSEGRHSAVSNKVAHPVAVAIQYVQHKDFGHLELDIGDLPTPELHQVPTGVELSFATGHSLRISEHSKAREVLGIESHAEAGRYIVLIRLACDCAVESSRAGKTFSIVLRDATTHTDPVAPAKDQKNEIAQLRQSLTAKLASLNAPPAPRSAPSSLPVQVQASLAPSIPRPACAPEFDINRWKGAEGFRETLSSLRHATADSHEAAPEMATLAEFYLAYGLAGEAQDTARTALGGDVPTADAERTRLQRDADIAALLRGIPIDAASPLLAEGPACERTDTPLWRALAAAAGHDPVGVGRDVHAARVALATMPEPLLQAFAFRLANAVDDNIAALRDLASAVRNASAGLPEDEDARFLLQARIARSGGDDVDEVSFLERAARHELTLPGVVAAERLAELGAAAEGEGASHSEAVLGDMARVYRGNRLGQDAAAALAERYLRHADYIAALVVADEDASPNGVRGTDSRGAALVARILRLLLIEPTGSNLPDPGERIALYLKYDGYATPGQVGDNIRLGAAKLMLSQDMASAALDVVHQLSDDVASTPQGKLVRAQVEALAGDPAVTLLLLRALPTSPDTQRAAADALERLGRPGDAARQLDGLTTIDDRMRRAALFGRAKAWSDATTAYADLLRDPTLTAEARQEVADRYGFALALSGNSPDPTLPTVQGGLASRTMSALPPKGRKVAAMARTPLSMPVIDGVLARAKQIETLLPSTDAKPGT